MKKLVLFFLVFYPHLLLCMKRKKLKRPIASPKEALAISTVPLNVRRDLEDAIVKGNTYTAKGLLNSFGSALANAWHSHEALKCHTLASYSLGRFQPEILRLLLKAGARSVDQKGESLLFIAIHYAQAECVQVLLEDGHADPNAITVTENPIRAMSGSLLSYNSYYFVGPIPPENTEVARRLHIARALLDHGADSTVKDKSDRTAIEVLDQNPERDCANKLKQFLLTYNPKKKIV